MLENKPPTTSFSGKRRGMSGLYIGVNEKRWPQSSQYSLREYLIHCTRHSWCIHFMLPVQMQGWNNGLSARPSERQTLQISAPSMSSVIVFGICDNKLVFYWWGIRSNFLSLKIEHKLFINSHSINNRCNRTFLFMAAQQMWPWHNCIEKQRE